MALFNYTAKEITLKVVYYGPGFSGKTTNLQQLHSMLPSESRGKLISLATEADRTLFFDFLPVDLGNIGDFNIRIQLYTVPGQVKYNATRRLVLKGADAVVFVADSQRSVREQNLESLSNMGENLAANNLDQDSIPLVLQFNKRDLNDIMSIDEMNNDLNRQNVPFFEAVAVEGKGVQETFKETMRILIRDIAEKHNINIGKSTIRGAHSETSKSVTAPPDETRGIQCQPEQKQVNVAVAEKVEVVEPQEEAQTARLEDVSEPSNGRLDFSNDLLRETSELKKVMQDIRSTLRNIQNTQDKTFKELSSFKKAVLEESHKKKVKKGFFGLFN
jgi:hypothetical protein